MMVFWLLIGKYAINDKSLKEEIVLNDCGSIIWSPDSEIIPIASGKL